MPEKILMVACERSVLAACTRWLADGDDPVLADVVADVLPVWSQAEPTIDLPREHLTLQAIDATPGATVLEDPLAHALQPDPGGPPQVIDRDGSRDLRLVSFSTGLVQLQTVRPTTDVVVDPIRLFVQVGADVFRYEQAPVSALKFFGPPYGARMDALLKFLIR